MSENKEKARDIIYALVCLERDEPPLGSSWPMCNLPRRDLKNWAFWLMQNDRDVAHATYVHYKVGKALEYGELMETERAVNKRLNQSPA